MFRLRCTPTSLIAALVLLGQGPLCELLCPPPGPMDVAAGHEAMPPCHGTGPGSEAAPPPSERSEHECASCDQIAAGSVSVADATAPLLAFHAGGARSWHAPAALRRPPGPAPPDDRAPPGSGRSLLLRKSSLLL